jgi:hypothetical protein
VRVSPAARNAPFYAAINKGCLTFSESGLSGTIDGVSTAILRSAGQTLKVFAISMTRTS